MVIAKVNMVGFIENDNQTIRFQKLCKLNLGMNKESYNRYYCEPSDGNYHWLVGATEDECIKKFQEYIKEDISRVIPDTDFSDFFFRLSISETEQDGFFWKPFGQETRTYRLSDLEIIQ